MRTGIVYNPVYLKHDTGKHVENPGRLETIMAHLQQTGLLSRLIPVSSRPATPDELARVHEIAHIRHIQSVAESGGGALDFDTVMSPGSFEAAVYAAGGTISAVEAVMEGKVDNAFALVRPPGHHATPYRAMGFCLFNNIAVAARHALSRYKLERLAIIDFDVHHGNGTQAAFDSESRVLYISTHQYPLYPGTGKAEESGSGEAMGTKVNIPLPPGCGDAEYIQVFEKIIAPATRRFQPQLILVSAGFDPHWADNIAAMQVSISGFAGIVKIIARLAQDLCQNRLVLSLEGGYNQTALSASVKATFEALLGDDKIEDPLGSPPQGMQPPNIDQLIGHIRKIQSLT